MSLGPGGLFVIESPPEICDRLGNSVNGPRMMTLTRSVIPVKLENARLLEVGVRESNLTTQQGFQLHNAFVTLRGLSFLEPNCPGRFCDGIGCYENGILSTRCSCFSKSIVDHPIVASMDLLLQSGSLPDKISVRFFTSKNATSFFLGMAELGQG